MKSLLVVILFLLAANTAFAQPSNPQIRYVTVAPSGACAATGIALLIPDGDVYTCDAGVWTLLSGGGGGGATTFSAITDCKLTATTTVLTVGATSSSTTPCIVQTYSDPVVITAPITFTLTTGVGSGLAKVYTTSAGAVNADLTTSVTYATWVSSGGNAIFSASPVFPDSSWQIGTVTLTSGLFATAAPGLVNLRSFTGRPQLQAGTGILIASGIASADPATVCLLGAACVFTGAGGINLTAGTDFAPPTNNTLPATCYLGQLHFDGNATAGQNLYGCTAANTWTLQGGSTVAQNGLVWVNGIPSSSSGTAAGTANQLILFETALPPSVRTYICGSVQTGTGNIVLGLYDSALAKIQQTGTLAAPGAVDVCGTLASPATVTGAGPYYVGFASSAAGDRFWGGPGYGADKGFSVNTVGTPSYLSCSNAMSGTTLPATCGTPTGLSTGTWGNIPGFAIK